jgi:hypothetical protein
MSASRTSRKPKREKPKKLPRRPSAEQAPRDHGKFVKGFSGNPTGARVIPAEIRELAREYGPAAILRLAALMGSADETIVIAACRELLNRGYGRPESTVNLPNGGALINFNMFAGGTGPIKVTSAEEAEAAYRAIAGDPKFDYSRIEWAAPPPETIAAPSEADPSTEGPEFLPAVPAQPSMAGDPTSNVSSFDEAKAARMALMIKLGQ